MNETRRLIQIGWERLMRKVWLQGLVIVYLTMDNGDIVCFSFL